VIAIIGEQRPAPFSGKQQLSSIRRTFASLLIGRRDMVPAINKETRQPQGNILVEVKRRHLRSAVRGEASVNRFRMLLVVCDCCVHGLSRNGECVRHIIGVVKGRGHAADDGVDRHTPFFQAILCIPLLHGIGMRLDVPLDERLCFVPRQFADHLSFLRGTRILRTEHDIAPRNATGCMRAPHPHRAVKRKRPVLYSITWPVASIASYLFTL